MRDLKLVDNMRELRIINGYSQQFVSNYIHIARQTYSLYETGRRLPDMKTVCDLADLYHISIDLLLYTDLSVDMEQISDAPASEYMATNLFLPKHSRRFGNMFCLKRDGWRHEQSPIIKRTPRPRPRSLFFSTSHIQALHCRWCNAPSHRALFPGRGNSPP